MPGAFTPTCSKEHLPGYVKSANKFADLGIDKITVVTTNDRYVNEEWSTQQGLFEKGGITIVCDGDGDLVKSMGLADDMGFGVGTRSKRFAMVTEDGKVVTLVTDEGLDDCSATSAANLLQILTPESALEEAGTGVDMKVIGAAGVALLALFASQMGGPAPAPSSRPSAPAPQSRVQPAKKGAPTSESSFSLLNNYMKK
jgi:peroxiredoxin